jgi:hypothetical protein
MTETEHWSHDRYWTDALHKLHRMREAGNTTITLDLKKISEVVYETKRGNIFLSTPAKSNAWITVYFYQQEKQVGLYLTFLKGSMGDMLYAKLVDDRELIEKELGVPITWQTKDGKHSIETHRFIPDLYAPQYRETIKEWLAIRANIP